MLLRNTFSSRALAVTWTKGRLATTRSFSSTIPRMHSRLIITPAELAALPPKATVPIDVSWFMPNVDRKPDEEFIKKRIPNARRMDLDVVASEHPLGLKHMMPTPEVFADACGTIGVTPSSHVVLYDTVGLFSSPRALFTFKAFGHENASILNGGLPRWEHEGYPTESGNPKVPERAVYPAPILNKGFIRDYEQIVQNSKAPAPTAEVVLDARSHGRFTGKDPEPRPSLSSGHIPNSLSLPFTDLVTPQATPSGSYTVLPPTEKFRNAIEAALGPHLEDVLTAKRSVVNSCGSGMTAAVLWLALKELGIESAIYDEVMLPDQKVAS
ncbi:hypothetical protein FRB99_003395 [Tulasnella sp. 403]|nr:hypothetical protein FRB99_003395 [Tulasnella sp. 403]